MIKSAPIYTFAPDKATLAKMKDFYQPFQSSVNNPYVDLFAAGEGVSVTIYKPNKKGEIKAVFQGENALEEAKMWKPDAQAQDLSPKIRMMTSPMHPGPVVLNRYPQIGSDEVGTGDFFGPICVCAAYVSYDELDRITELKVTDSKKMEDDYILSIGPSLIHEFEYSQLSLPNEKYNEIHDEFNMNAIKAKMHNRCDLNLVAKHPDAHVYQDQFAEAGLYYHYLQGEKEVVRNIYFHTKGESLFPSVALASVIARYSFLRKMQELTNKYQMPIPFGAGEDVDRFVPKFIERYGKNELDKIVKKNFANYKKIS
jgi:ribonuclease HIII